jgi:colicin import membrane protein
LRGGAAARVKLDFMPTTSQLAPESSVLFNLRELMQLESQRAAAEDAQARQAAEAQQRAIEDAERALREAAAQREREREALLTRERAAAEAAEQAETERQAALLRVRLEAEVLERALRAQAAAEHAAELARLAGIARSSRRRSSSVAALLVLGCSVATLAVARNAESRVAAVRSEAEQTVRRLAAQARAPQRSAPPATPLARETPTTAAAVAVSPARVVPDRPRKGRRNPRTTRQPEAPVDLDFGSNDSDPIGELTRSDWSR